MNTRISAQLIQAFGTLRKLIEFDPKAATVNVKKNATKTEDERKINAKFQPNESNCIDPVWVTYVSD